MPAVVSISFAVLSVIEMQAIPESDIDASDPRGTSWLLTFALGPLTMMIPFAPFCL